jgi:thioester reductase-like protein
VPGWRGLVVRAWRALAALELIEKLVWRNKVALIARLEEQLADRELEIHQLRARIMRLRAVVGDQKSGESNEPDGGKPGEKT